MIVPTASPMVDGRCFSVLTRLCSRHRGAPKCRCKAQERAQENTMASFKFLQFRRGVVEIALVAVLASPTFRVSE
jgi:hypothetical protein